MIRNVFLDMYTSASASRKLYDLPKQRQGELHALDETDSRVTEANEILNYIKANVIGVDKKFCSAFGSRKGTCTHMKTVASFVTDNITVCGC